MMFRLQVFTQISSKHQHNAVCLDYRAYKIWHDFLPTSNKPDVGSENITRGVFPPQTEDDDYENTAYLNDIANEEEDSEYH